MHEKEGSLEERAHQHWRKKRGDMVIFVRELLSWDGFIVCGGKTLFWKSKNESGGNNINTQDAREREKPKNISHINIGEGKDR